MVGGYSVIDLFAGAGGLTLGFRWAGFVPVLAVEKEPDFAKTYAANFGDHVVAGDIIKVVEGGRIPKADVVVGGPPCQGFSNLTGNKKDDPRRKLWQYYMDVVEASGCKVFVVENVPNLLKSPEGQGIIKRARELGYDVGEKSMGYLMASKFGVPQNRKRAIIIGSKIGPIPLPEPNGKRMTVRQALKGIPLKPTKTSLPERESEIYSGLDLHIGRNPEPTSIKRYKLIPPGGNRFDLQRLAPELTPPCWIRKTKGGTDLFGRLHWDEPARCTIRCEFYKPEKGRYLHPSEHRPITHLEAARLQTFPDTFKWYGRKIRIAIQIGNAVPPVLAQAIAEQVKAHLEAAKSKPRPKPKRAHVEQLQLLAV
jgi:DNA (cytosine-5)-methyltransferase 1